MSLALKVYEAFKDDEPKARVLAEAFEQLEQRIPPNIATVEHLRENTRQLELKIESVRREIEQLRGEFQTTRLELEKQIEELRGDFQTTRPEIEKQLQELRGHVVAEVAPAKVAVIQWVCGLLLAQLGALAALIKFL